MPSNDESIRGVNDIGKRPPDPIQDSQRDDSRDIIPPDGGWGWLVVLGAFFNTTLSALLSMTFALVYASFFIEKNFSTTTTAWLFNANQFTWNFFGFFANSLFVRYGWRRISFLGGLIMAISTAASCFAQEAWHIFITFSLFTGIGQGFVVLAALSIVPHYFDKKKGLAAGPPIAGISAAQFIGPLLVRYLLENYDFRGTNLILGAIILHSCFFSLFFHPVDWHAKRQNAKSNIPDVEFPVLKNVPEEGYRVVNNIPDVGYPMLREIEKEDSIASTPILGLKGRRRSSIISLEKISLSLERSSLVFMETSSLQRRQFPPEDRPKKEMKKEDSILKLILINLKILQSHRAKIISISIPLYLSAYMNFLMLLPLSMMNEGFSLNVISWSLAAAGIFNFIFRLVISALTDCLPISTKYYFMTGALGIFLTSNIYTVISNPTLIILLMCIYGACVGACGGLLSLIPLEFMGLQDTSKILGLYGLLSAILFIAIGPFIGLIRDASQSFNTAIRVLSIVPLTAFVLWLFMPLAITSDAKKKEAKSKNEIYLET